MATKSSLRKIITKTLKDLDANEFKRQSDQVFEKLVRHQKFREAERISLYLSTSIELDTIKILKHALEVDKKQCFVPYIPNHQIEALPSTRMLMVELKSMQHYEELPRNRYGIKEVRDLVDWQNEPLQVAEAQRGELDLIIVPGVAFSLDGRRLGHGMGYYDEFLNDWSLRCPKSKPLYSIGLAMREQVVDDPLAIEGQDFNLDEILFTSS